MKIDFVITWVDGNDPQWRKEKNQYTVKKEADGDECRYRDMELLKYWFRAVEAYAPWVNKIHFVTYGHLPQWLNCDAPKLNIVNHTDFIPEKYLPTFSSHPIELNMHRIKDLSEAFVYFNDDFFLNAPVSQEFFFKKGLPCDYIYAKNIFFEDIDDVYAHVCASCIAETNKHFSYAESFFKNPFKYINFRYGLKNNIKNILKLENTVSFTGIDDSHLPAAYLKNTFEEAWEASPEALDRVSSNKFRTTVDVSQSVFRYRQLASGKFSPVSKKSRGKYFRVSNDNSELIKTLNDKSCNMICINDVPGDIDFEKAKKEIAEAFEKLLNKKSEFEL